MKFGFVTCVELGLSCMREIDRVGGRLDLIVTLQDDVAPRKAGRVHVDDFADAHGSRLLKIRDVNDPAVSDAIAEESIDWLFVIGWSQIVRKTLLDAPRKGVLGMHPTLLPTGRGRASIPWAIIKGLDETGVTLFQLDEGVDTGPIVAQQRVPLSARETATTLYARIAEAHRNLIARHWDDLAADRLRRVPQDHGAATEWPGRTPADGRIDPAMTVNAVDRLVRATTHPYPGAFWDDGDRRLRIWSGRSLENAEGPPAGPVVTVADGEFEALDYAWEDHPGTVTAPD